MGPQQVFFTAYHSANLIIFIGAVVYAWKTVARLQDTSVTYNGRLLPFAYFSLSSWFLWALQYIILTGPFKFFPNGFFLDTGLWLGVVQNALWASAVLSLQSKKFSRISLINLPIWIVLPIVIALALLTYRTAFLRSDFFINIDAVSAAAIFTTFAYAILQWRLNRMYAAFFFIHGYFQWIWRSLWFTPLAGTQIAILLAFPVWRIALLIVWIKFLSSMLASAQPSYQKIVRDIEHLALPNPLDTFGVMISSTEQDLVKERDAAARAIDGLLLTKIRAETFGSLSYSPRDICALLAERCDIFILIIGERYGYQIKPEGISVVEFEFQVAYAQNPEKILVYVKDGVKRESQLEEFLHRVQDFEHGYFRSSFTTPEDLYEKIQRDIARWLTSHVKQKYSNAT